MRFLRSFHRDQSGLNTLDQVMTLAIAAIVAIAIYALGQRLVEWAKAMLDGNV